MVRQTSDTIMSGAQSNIPITCCPQWLGPIHVNIICYRIFACPFKEWLNAHVCLHSSLQMQTTLYTLTYIEIALCFTGYIKFLMIVTQKMVQDDFEKMHSKTVSVFSNQLLLGEKREILIWILCWISSHIPILYHPKVFKILRYCMSCGHDNRDGVICHTSSTSFSCRLARSLRLKLPHFYLAHASIVEQLATH